MKFQKKYYNLEILFNNIKENKISLNEIDNDEKNQCENLLKSFKINKTFEEIYNFLRLSDKKNSMNKISIEEEIPNQKSNAYNNIKSSNNSTENDFFDKRILNNYDNIYNNNTIKKRTYYNKCYQYHLKSIDKTNSWNIYINLNKEYSKELDVLYHRIDKCSIPHDGIIGNLGLLFKPDLIKKANELFKYACNAHDMCYHCGPSYSFCDHVLYQNCKYLCKNNYDIVDYADYEDCMSDSELILLIFERFVNNSASPKKPFYDNHKVISDNQESDKTNADCICNDFDKVFLSVQPFNIIDYTIGKKDFKESNLSYFYENFISSDLVAGSLNIDHNSNIATETCGNTIGKCDKGYCCSKYGYCGTTKEYCE